MQSLFFLITTMFQMRINKKITFNKHSAQKYIRAYIVPLPLRHDINTLSSSDETNYSSNKLFEEVIEKKRS